MNLPERLHRALLPRRQAEPDVNSVIGAFESETVAVFNKTSPTSEHIVVYALAGMMLLAFVLSAVVKLDRVVAGGGTVMPVGGSLYVSPINTAIVKQVLVKAGDVVKQGQQLAVLDPTFTQADLFQLQQKFQSDQAALARLQAEQDGKPYVGGSDSYQTLQASIYKQRQAEYQSTVADFDARIGALQAQLNDARKNSAEYDKRLRLAGDVEKMYRPLAEKGYVSRLQWMSATDSKVELNRMQAGAQNEIQSSSQNLASMRAQKEAFIRKWRSDVASNLVQTKNDLEQTRQGLEKSQKLQELTSLDAPQDAVVLKVGKISQGSVTGVVAGDQNADPLFTLVPLDAPVEAEIHVLARDIGFIKVGDNVKLKLDAYQFMRHGTAKGVIKTVSEGSFTKDDNNQPVKEPYFKVRIAITEVKLRNVPEDFRIIPGMTLTGDILVGKRTILSYLVEGALRTGSEAMREPM